ncbi:MAG: hypothetical protein M0007_01595 [Actinomycetota bacterium]|nr:hypothetical protein [Actinomycetota bacterium]
MRDDEERARPASAEEAPTAGRARRGGVATVDREGGGTRGRPGGPATVRRAGGLPAGGRPGAPVAEQEGAGGTGTAGVGPERRPWVAWRRRAVGAVALLGLVGTLVFGHAWAVQRQQAERQAQVRSVANGFLLALTNFDTASVDADFNRVQAYATGTFATQSTQFFGSSIRSQLQTALASSRGQIRSLFVQSLVGGTATVFAVVDQTYVNAKMTAPAADVLRIVLDLADRPAGWKVADVTVLGNGSATPATGSSSQPAPAVG